MRRLLNIWTLVVTAVLLMGAGTTYYSLKSTDSPIFANIKLSDLSDGKIPYHIDDATGLADGPTKTDVDDAVSKKHTRSHAISSTSDHSDVNLAAISNNDLMRWDDPSSKWLPKSIAEVVSGNIIDPSNVRIASLTDGYIPYHVDDTTGFADGPTKTDVDDAVSKKHSQNTDTGTSENFTMVSGKYLATDKVRAVDGDGLYLVDDDDKGIFVDDGGQVEITDHSLKLKDTTSSTTGVIYKGTDPYIHNFHHPTGDTAVPDGYNFFCGKGAGNFTMGSGATETYHGSYNSVGGACDALSNNTTGYRNSVGAGYEVLNINTTGWGNSVGAGYSVLNSNTSGYQNSVGAGYGVLNSNTSGYRNSVGAGYEVLNKNTTGFWNSVGAGYEVLANNTTGSYHAVGAGYGVLYKNTSGVFNSVGAGYGALYRNTTGSYNSVGAGCALSGNTTGSCNTADGHYAGRYIADGTTDNTTSDYCVLIGYDTKVEADNDQNEIVIGYNAIGNGSNTVTLGNTSISELHCQVALTVDSDRRVKKDIADNTAGLEFINKLQPVTFKKLNPADYPEEIKPPEYKQRVVKEIETVIDKKGKETQKEIDVTLEPDPRPADNPKTYTGLIAQDVEKALAESGLDVSLVTTNKQGKKGITYENLIPILITAVQELSAKVTKLESERQN